MITPSFSLTATERVLPKLALDFTTANLDPRITFTRSGSTATRVNSSGYIEAVAADTPRFDFNPITLVCRGLLVEELRVNSALQSESFNVTTNGWSLTRTAVTADQTTSPANTLTADLLAETAVSGAHLVEPVSTALTAVTSGQTYTQSIFVKKGTGASAPDIVQLTHFGATFGVSQYANFDISVSLSTSGTVRQSAGGTATISAFPNGWYRISWTATATGNGNDGVVLAFVNNNPAFTRLPSYTGNTAADVFIWGAQFEAGAFATSYIPTTTTALTRNADVATMTGTNFSNWYNATQGTFRVDARTPASGTRPLISADDNTSGNSIVMSTVGTAPKLVVTQSSAEQANVSAGTITANTAMFVYASYASNYFGIARPSARQVDTSGTVPTVDRLRIGADQAGNYANGQIQAIQFWP